MGPDSEHRSDVASGVQKSFGVLQPGRSLQAVGSMARKAGARFERSDAADDAASPAQTLNNNANSRGSKRQPTEKSVLMLAPVNRAGLAIPEIRSAAVQIGAERPAFVIDPAIRDRTSTGLPGQSSTKATPSQRTLQLWISSR